MLRLKAEASAAPGMNVGCTVLSPRASVMGRLDRALRLAVLGRDLDAPREEAAAAEAGREEMDPDAEAAAAAAAETCCCARCDRDVDEVGLDDRPEAGRYDVTAEGAGGAGWLSAE